MKPGSTRRHSMKYPIPGFRQVRVETQSKKASNTAGCKRIDEFEQIEVGGT